MSQRSAIRLIVGAAMVLMIAGVPASARRGGSFGSRGSRTYMAPRSPVGSTRYVPPVERSMTARSSAQAAPYADSGFRQSQPYRNTGSRFGGFGGGLIGGLIAGGLLGHFFGHGIGGGLGSGGGLLASLLQIALLGGVVWLIVGFFRRRGSTQTAPARGSLGQGAGLAPQAGPGPWGAGASPPQAVSSDTTDIMLTQADQDAFERLLIAVQDAFGHEDYGTLRQLTTPEIMSYLSEELAQNATQGLRNDVHATRLIDGEVSEAWREAGGDYATIVMRYESIDVVRNRSTNAIVSGSEHAPTEAKELWTFVRAPGDNWKLSAIQES